YKCTAFVAAGGAIDAQRVIHTTWIGAGRRDSPFCDPAGAFFDRDRTDEALDPVPILRHIRTQRRGYADRIATRATRRAASAGDRYSAIRLLLTSVARLQDFPSGWSDG